MPTHQLNFTPGRLSAIKRVSVLDEQTANLIDDLLYLHAWIDSIRREINDVSWGLDG